MKPARPTIREGASTPRATRGGGARRGEASEELRSPTGAATPAPGATVVACERARAVMSEAVDPSSDVAPSVGARVQLHSLLRTPEHNGAEGEVVEFDLIPGRWRIRLAGPDGRELALKASNLAVLIPVPQAPATVEMMIGAHVEIRSLVRSPELNGVRGQVVEPQDPGTGRCGVKIDSDGRLLALKPANLARLCGNAACRKALAPPLLKCFKCKGEAYCDKACQVE